MLNMLVFDSHSHRRLFQNWSGYIGVYIQQCLLRTLSDSINFNRKQNQYKSECIEMLVETYF